MSSNCILFTPHFMTPDSKVQMADTDNMVFSETTFFLIRKERRLKNM